MGILFDISPRDLRRSIRRFPQEDPVPGRWGEIPFAALAPCLALGITASRLVEQYLFLLLAAGEAGLAAAAWVALCRNRRRSALFAALAAVLVTGLALALARRDGYPAHDLRALLSRNEAPLGVLTQFEGCLADHPDRRSGETIATLALRAYQKNGAWAACRGGVILRIPDIPEEGGPSLQTELRIGDRVRGWATWHVPRNFQNPGSPDHIETLRRRGIFLIGRIKSPRLLEIIPGDCGGPWTAITAAVEKDLQKTLNKLRNNGDPRQAALLASLIIGDYSGLDAETRLSFQNSGTYHVLVVSGLHVAWIAGVLLCLFRILRIPTGPSRLLTAVLLMIYTGLVGFQASISRSLWMFVLFLIGQAAFRRAVPANITLAAAFFLLAMRPDWLFDIGFQLSFLAVLAISLMGAPLISCYLQPLFNPVRHAGQQDRLSFDRGYLHCRGRRIRVRWELFTEACADRLHPRLDRPLLACVRASGGLSLILGSMVVMTLSVQIWLEPLLAFHFNRLSWIAPLANLVAVPLSSLVLAAGMVAVLAARIDLIAPFMLQIAGFLSDLLLRSAQLVSGTSGAWQRCPTPSPLLVVAGIVLLFSWWFAGWRRKWIPLIYVGLMLAGLSTGLPILKSMPRMHHEWSRDRPILSLTFLDVGEGDSAVMAFPDGSIWIVDAGGIHQSQSQGSSDRGFDVGEAVVSRYLWHQWITRLDRIVLSHADLDHAGGVPALLLNFRTNALQIGEHTNDDYLESILSTAKERRTGLERAWAGQTSMAGGVKVEVLNPPDDGESRSANEGCVVLRISYGRFSALLAGDLEKAGERDFLVRNGDIRSQLLKVAHHGSRFATTDGFLERVQPRWALLSSGRNNPFGHPAKEVVFRLLGCGARLLLTQDHGAIAFETDGSRYLIRSCVGAVLERGWLPCTAGGSTRP